MTIHPNFPNVGPTFEAEASAVQNAQHLPPLQTFLKMPPNARAVLLNTIAQQLYQEMLSLQNRKASGAACRRDKEKIVRRWKRLRRRAVLIEHRLRIRVIFNTKVTFQNVAWSAEFRMMLIRAHRKYHAQ